MRQARIAIVLTLAAIGAAPLAKAQSDPTIMARHALGNQLGVLEFCQSRGDVGSDAVSAEKTALDRLPASTVSTDSDETLGKSGTLAAPNGQNTTLAGLAAQKGVTVSALCKQLGDSAIQSATAMKAGGSMPPMPGAMPSMPGGMSMPAMPGGMPMPAIPGGMPRMPGMPSSGSGPSQ